MSEHMYDKSEFEFKRAISLNPSYAQAHHWYAFCLAVLKRYGEAFVEIGIARKMDPFSPVIATATGMIYWYSGRDEEALKQWVEVKERWPGFFWVYYLLGLCLLDKGRTKEAFDNLTSPVLAKSREDYYKSALAYAHAVSGQREEALKLLTDLKNLSEQRYVSPDAFAIIYQGLGDDDLAFEYLNREVEEGGALDLRDFPIFRRLHQNPRYSSLLRKMNLKL